MNTTLDQLPKTSQQKRPKANKRVWGWWSFDIASQPYFTLGLSFIFAPYFVNVATELFAAEGLNEVAADARAQSLWSLGQTITGLFIALLAPILGAFADNTGRRLPWVALFSMFYVLGSALLWFLAPDGNFLIGALIAFGIGLIGAEFTTIFTNSLLPELGPREEIGRISGTGFALGYAGGVIALFIMLLLFVEQDTGKTLIGLDPALGLDAGAKEGTRAVGPFMALWFVLFMIPFALWVTESKVQPKPGGATRALGELWDLIKGLPRQVSLFSFLCSSMFYRDALNALYTFGGTYAALVLNWSIVKVGVFGIIAAIASALATWIGGKFDARLGPKPVIVAMVIILTGICLLVLGMTESELWGQPISTDLGPMTLSLPFIAEPFMLFGAGLIGAADLIFFACGAVLGAAGGVLQSSSRTLMVFHSETGSASKAFGLYALSGKATAFLGPALIFAATSYFGDVRLGMLPLVGLFAISLIILFWVDPEGRPQA